MIDYRDLTRKVLPPILSIAVCGAVAQLGARLNGIQKVRGSNPLSSTKSRMQNPGEPDPRILVYGATVLRQAQEPPSARFALKQRAEGLARHPVNQQAQPYQHHKNRASFVG